MGFEEFLLFVGFLDVFEIFSGYFRYVWKFSAAEIVTQKLLKFLMNFIARERLLKFYWSLIFSSLG